MATPFDEVREDLEEMFRESLTEVTLRSPETFAGHGATELTAGDGLIVAVPWELEGLNDEGLFMGLRQGTRVFLRGVTVYDVEKELFYRYIDWSTMLDELGLGASIRPISTPQNDAG